MAIITGAAGNNGRECVRRYLLEGANVVLVDIDAVQLDQFRDVLVQTIQNEDLSTQTDVYSIRENVMAQDDMRRSVHETAQKFGRLDIAVLCVGISYPSTSILDTDVSQYDTVMQVNCRSSSPYSYSPDLSQG